MLRNMFKKTYTIIDSHYKHQKEEPSIPEGLWRKCNKCGQPIYVEDVKNNFYICPKCGGYFRVHAYRRLEMLLDEGSFEEWNQEMPFSNPLDFPGYEKKVESAREKTGLNEAIVTGKGRIDGFETAVGVCDARFMMSSMGHVVGEKITQMVERATKEKLPVILFACSGGARMQEGLVSLMQMAKTSSALERHHEAGQLFVSVLTDPTTGGVTASFAMLGDIILAEPGALIGFAGPRVIQQTIGQKLPEGFQRAEFLLEHGFVDQIVERDQQREVLAQILKLHCKPEKEKSETAQTTISTASVEDVDNTVEESGKKWNNSGKSAWDMVQLSRDSHRPTALDYIHAIFDGFMEFHGDRYFGDDGAIVGGIASFHGTPVTVIGQQKGKTTKDNLKRNFGMPSPEGYRKALRLMRQAEKFHRPVICFVDTSGAFCGEEAEERGQGQAIADNLMQMMGLETPIITIVIGEGGSGGALGLSVANKLYMLENAVFSVISPEGCASILWEDAKLAPDAAECLHITAEDMKEFGVAEEIIPEDFVHFGRMCDEMKEKLILDLKGWSKKTGKELSEERYQRFRKLGRWAE